MLMNNMNFLHTVNPTSCRLTERLIADHIISFMTRRSLKEYFEIYRLFSSNISTFSSFLCCNVGKFFSRPHVLFIVFQVLPAISQTILCSCAKSTLKCATSQSLGTIFTTLTMKPKLFIFTVFKTSFLIDSYLSLTYMHNRTARPHYVRVARGVPKRIASSLKCTGPRANGRD